MHYPFDLYSPIPHGQTKVRQLQIHNHIIHLAKQFYYLMGGVKAILNTNSQHFVFSPNFLGLYILEFLLLPLPQVTIDIMENRSQI